MSRVAFAHASEAELAKILDCYRVDWEYEPRTFPIVWNEDGRPVEFFTPDFYLPEYDCYIELTVAKPVRNNRKNRKIRLLQQHHPNTKAARRLTRRDSDLRELGDRRALVWGLGGGVGHVIAIEARHLVLLEVNHQVTLCRSVQPPMLEVVEIVPAVVVEHRRYHGSAEQVAHLRARHADLQPIDGLALEVVALLDVHAVNASAE
jgi:hypothetical protein